MNLRTPTHRLAALVAAACLALSLAACDDDEPATADDTTTTSEDVATAGDGTVVGDTGSTDDGAADADTVSPSDTTATDSGGDTVEPPSPTSGWTDPRDFLVESDGTWSLGDPSLEFNDTRDQGSKLVYFDVDRGDNASAEVYWWDGAQLVDSSGSPTNADGAAYGDDPLNPNLDAIAAFASYTNSGDDDRLVTQQATGLPPLEDGSNDTRWRFAGTAGGYPDWFLFRRGQVHTDFDRRLAGGRSEDEPMVIAAYGDEADGRAIFDPGEATNPFTGHNWGKPEDWMHQAVFSAEIRAGYGYLNTHTSDSFAGGPTTAYLEDVRFPGLDSGIIVYPPQKTTFRRTVVTYSWNDAAHNQGYFTSGYENQVTFDESILYKNGYKNDPTTDPDPQRDIFSRNIYQGGGAQMGHTYRNIISADGASGGPQMRLGGLMEHSLVIEGYWFSSTSSPIGSANTTISRSA